MTANDDAARMHVLGALALELAPGSGAARLTLAQADAGALAQHLARDLAGFAPAATRLDLVTVGAHYDPVELLRPGWPVHAELERLAARAPAPAERAHAGAEDLGRIIAFGAHQDVLPGGLAPDPDHAGGPLRLVPFALAGDPAVAAAVGDAFERELIEHGMAGAATALAAQDAFGLRVEHARYLTLHDLAALLALQYEHAGLAPLWPLLEAALLAPEQEEWLDAPPEPLVRYAAGEARIALFSPKAWHARYGGDDADGARLERRFQQFQARQRQFAAVLGAHGVPVTFVDCDRGADARAALA
ncbi:hypothetical protein [Vulcaniibacterium gelatinicum]|uniref:hypothetical protein n=1 Tax=Vulcaniibacterium gelatinicum TaxID=2598725 RepID=UPI001FE29869|nr:hypothetical protein [Vulcaniibacterium gelatinicum]